MARLPSSLPMQAPSAPASQGLSLDFSGVDRVLQQAAGHIERVDAARTASADRQAEEILREVETTYEPAFGERAGGYDGRAPGFASAELQQFDAALAPVLARDDLPDHVREAVERRARVMRVRAGERAVGVEAQTRGQRAAADRRAAEQATALQGLMAFNERFDAFEDEARADWDGATPGYTSRVVAGFQAAADEVLEGLPAGAREVLEPMLASRKVDLHARLMTAEDEGRDARTLATANDAINAYVNRVQSNPALYSRLEQEIEPVLALVPAFARDALRAEARQMAALAALEGRIEAGEHEAVGAELNAGAFDWLPANRKAQMLDRVEAAAQVRDVDDYVAAQDLEARLAADLDVIMRTGRGDATLVPQAEAILGPARAAEHRLAAAAAQAAQPFVSRLKTLSPSEIQDAIDGMRPTGNATAVQQRVFEGVSALAQAELTARQADPASWAMTAPTPTDPGARVQSAWRTLQDAEGPEARTAAQAYARQTLAVQEAGSVPEGERRVLPRPVAQALAARIEARGADVGDALIGLAGYAGRFGEYQPRVLRELREAGLSDADYGALRHYADDPVALGRYVSARGVEPPPARDRQRIEREVERELRPYLETTLSTAGGAEGAPSTMEAVLTTAYALTAQGRNPREAARMAVEPITGEYHVVDTWRIPRAVNAPPTLIRTNARHVVNDLLRGDGEGLRAPPLPGYTPEQARRLHADAVRETGAWATLPDDSGLTLRYQDARGRWRDVLDAEGLPVRRTWEQLRRGGAPGRR